MITMLVEGESLGWQRVGGGDNGGRWEKMDSKQRLLEGLGCFLGFLMQLERKKSDHVCCVSKSRR